MATVQSKFNTTPTRPIPFICIDAGHYGKYNQSPANKKYYEAEAMWKLHLLQKKYLQEYGFQVITTREKQEIDLALKARGQKSEGCVLFISNHSNAVDSYVNENVDYVAIYRLTDDATTKCDDASKEIGDILAPVIAEVMDAKQGYRVVARKSSNDRNGDGMLNDNYYGVLHGARIVGTPGLILEHSFHTNTRATNWLLDDGNLDKLARAEADAIAQYFGMEKIELLPKIDVWHRVQVGAYEIFENAKVQYEKVRAAGFDAFVIKVDGLYKIQVGAYKVKENAEAQLARVKAAGFDAFITTKGGTAVSMEEIDTLYYPIYKGDSTIINVVLKEIGVPEKYIGSWDVRKPVAEANGITNYTGTSEQNLKLIGLAKKGMLARV